MRFLGGEGGLPVESSEIVGFGFGPFGFGDPCVYAFGAAHGMVCVR